jgi:ribosomal protein S18 acetylase RimI-like enzyme
MRLVDLHQLNAHQLAPLLDEEAALWRSELHWDYRFSLDLIKKFIDTRSLAGTAAMDGEHPVGYGFYVIEEHKGMLGGLFVSPKYGEQPVGEQLLGDIVQTLRGTPQVARIEAQLMPFGGSLDRILSGFGFRLFPRQFMLRKVGEKAAPANLPTGLRLERWQERHMTPCADLIHLTYANHIDGQINDQYRSRTGAAKFLQNIVILPGCGQFEARASFVLHEVASDQLIGVVLTSMVAPGIGHTTQLCVLPGHQGNGLGRQLMQASLEALHEIKASELSLTVTSSNTGAVRLYESLGFKAMKSFVAGVWAI